jgi:hemerythrin-like domain-containing protein
VAETMRLLCEEHANLAKLLYVLERQVEAFNAGGQPDYDIIEGVIAYCLSFPDLCHHPKEDLLYRKLVTIDPDAADEMADLEVAHEELAALTRKFASTIHQVLHDPDAQRVTFARVAQDFLYLYRRHIEMEETAFFPAALKALGPEDWAEIDAQVSDREDPLFGAKVEKRFADLRREILDLDRAGIEGQD